MDCCRLSSQSSYKGFDSELGIPAITAAACNSTGFELSFRASCMGFEDVFEPIAHSVFTSSKAGDFKVIRDFSTFPPVS